ncbi:MAG: hypothetical protein M3137_16055 [Actinomycetota bacterium]|nr:hypothetical protein [Actinomycetota bacterium]
MTTPPDSPARSGMRHAFARRYGAGPLHLLALLASFAFAGYVVDRVIGVGDPIGIGIWFACALVAHDLVLFPLYSLADRSLRSRSRRHPETLPNVPWINHIRMPVLVSGMLLLVSFPLVFKIDVSDYHSATGLNPDPYLARWLLITAVLFAASAIIYAVRLGRAGRSGPPEAEPPEAEPPGEVVADRTGD